MKTIEIIFLTLFIISLGIAIYFFSKSPIAKALSDMVGLAGTAANAFNKQIEDCSDKGWFNVGSGCFLGLGLLGFGIISLFGSVAGLVGAFKKGKLSLDIQKAQAMEGKSEGEIINEIINDSDLNKILEEAETKGFSDEMTEVSLKKALTRTLTKRNVENLKKQSLSPEELKSKINEQKKSYVEIEEDVAREARESGLTEDETNEIDDLVDSADSPPIFEEFGFY